MGCGGITTPSEPASQEGIVVERDRPTSFEKDRPTIWVKDDLEAECGVIYVIARSTDLFTRDADGRVSQIGVDDVTVGAAVRVWTDLILTSCPGQATADAVELVGSS
jgi:hypothetical protein